MSTLRFFGMLLPLGTAVRMDVEPIFHFVLGDQYMVTKGPLNPPPGRFNYLELPTGAQRTDKLVQRYQLIVGADVWNSAVDSFVKHQKRKPKWDEILPVLRSIVGPHTWASLHAEQQGRILWAAEQQQPMQCNSTENTPVGRPQAAQPQPVEQFQNGQAQPLHPPPGRFDYLELPQAERRITKMRRIKLIVGREVWESAVNKCSMAGGQQKVKKKDLLKVLFEKVSDQTWDSIKKEINAAAPPPAGVVQQMQPPAQQARSQPAAPPQPRVVQPQPVQARRPAAAQPQPANEIYLQQQQRIAELEAQVKALQQAQKRSREGAGNDHQPPIKRERVKTEPGVKQEPMYFFQKYILCVILFYDFFCHCL